MKHRGVNMSLAVGALVLAGLGAFEVIRGRESPALAEMVAQSGGLVALTADAGAEDVLLMLDERAEVLYVYRTDPRTGVQLLQSLPLPQLFAEARARTLGKP